MANPNLTPAQVDYIYATRRLEAWKHEKRKCLVTLTDLNKLEELPPLPIDFKVLILDGRSLKSLPAFLPPSLETLRLNNVKGISQLPPLPSTLKELTVMNCSFTSLPPLPQSLLELECHSTPISTLPPLPPNLKRLDCCLTKLTELPPLPQGLETLECSHGPLKQLPSLPPSLYRLFVGNTYLIKLPELPSKLEHLYCVPTPFLTELPYLPLTLTGGYWDLHKFPEFPNHPYVDTSQYGYGYGYEEEVEEAVGGLYKVNFIIDFNHKKASYELLKRDVPILCSRIRGEKVSKESYMVQKIIGDILKFM